MLMAVGLILSFWSDGITVNEIVRFEAKQLHNLGEILIALISLLQRRDHCWLKGKDGLIEKARFWAVQLNWWT